MNLKHRAINLLREHRRNAFSRCRSAVAHYRASLTMRGTNDDIADLFEQTARDKFAAARADAKALTYALHSVQALSGQVFIAGNRLVLGAAPNVN